MSMKNKLLGGAVLLMSAFSLNEVQATSCAVPPTCAQLGYTMKKADCGEKQALRCPFALSDDNQVYCSSNTAGENPTYGASIGDIVYGDGTVAHGFMTGQTPIGIVFDSTNRLAIALTDINKDGTPTKILNDQKELDAFEAGVVVELGSWADMNYSKDKYYDIPNLTNCKRSSGTTSFFENDKLVSTTASCSADGRTNTNKILACGENCHGTPAATAVNNYQPEGCNAEFCKKTKWFLPSIKELIAIATFKKLIFDKLLYLRDFGIEARFFGMDNKYWSSNEEGAKDAWLFNFSYTQDKYFRAQVIDKSVVGSIRPVIAF